MLNSTIPPKFSVIWGASAPGGGITTPIPVPSQIGVTPGRASLTDGFPPLCFQPVGSGGIPPFGADFNGVLNQITAWVQWYSAGGAVAWDSAFSTAVGGYPKGAVVASAVTLGFYWLSTVDTNTTNPDTGGANWYGFSVGAPPNNYFADTGVVNALVITPPIPLAAYTNGLTFQVNPARTNTLAPTINVSGVGPIAIVNPDGSVLTGAELVASQIMELVYQAGVFQWLNAPGYVTNLIANSNVVWPTSGTANALIISPSPAVLVRNGLSYFAKPSAPNTTAATLNATGAALPLIRSDGAALQAGDLATNTVFRATYDAVATAWRMAGPVPSQLAGNGLKADTAGRIALDIVDLTSKPSPLVTDLVPIYDSAGLVNAQVTITALGNTIGAIVLPAGTDANAFFYGIF